jgi:hypothetical protein
LGQRRRTGWRGLLERDLHLLVLAADLLVVDVLALRDLHGDRAHDGVAGLIEVPEGHGVVHPHGVHPDGGHQGHVAAEGAVLLVLADLVGHVVVAHGHGEVLGLVLVSTADEEVLAGEGDDHRGDGDVVADQLGDGGDVRVPDSVAVGVVAHHVLTGGEVAHDHAVVGVLHAQLVHGLVDLVGVERVVALTAARGQGQGGQPQEDGRDVGAHDDLLRFDQLTPQRERKARSVTSPLRRAELRAQ